MNRQIKFRFWRDNKMQMAYQLNAYENYNFSGDGEILMQFTGLLDKNGKEIYEGDLVQHTDWDYPFKIIFYQQRARFVCELKSGLTNHIDYERLAVVGNFFENPELLNP